MHDSIFFSHVKQANQIYFNLPEYIEYYTVNLLDDFVTKQIQEEPFATRLMNAAYLTGYRQFLEYKTIGDECLILLGYFEQKIEASANNKDYYRFIGSSGYKQAGLSSGQTWLFGSLAEKFEAIERLIKATRKIMKVQVITNN